MGSQSKNGDGDGGGGATQGIPAATKKLIQNLKEVVNCTDFTEQEIYAVLRECDMDPNRAVEKLLAQDSFHEVKSKRERRKEKEALDSRSRVCNVGLSCGGKTGSEQNTVQSGPTYMSYNELGKATNKEEMGSVCPAVSSSSTHYMAKYISRRQSIGTGDTISAAAHVPPAVQSPGVGLSKGLLSMADIVKMDRPHKSYQLSNETSHASEDADRNHHPKASGVSAPGESESSSSVHSQNPSRQQVYQWNFESAGGQVSQGDVSGSHSSDNTELESKSSRYVTNNTGLASCSNYNLKNTGSSEHQQGTLTSDALVNVVSAVSDLEQLSLGSSKLEVPPSSDNCAVVLPNHLEALAADCSHLSFGTYNHVITSVSSAMPASNFSKSDLDETTATIDGSSPQYLDARNSVRHGNKRGWFDIPRETADDRSYDFLSSPQREPVKGIISEATVGREYTTMSSFPDPSLRSSLRQTSALPFKKPDFHGGTFSRDMHAGSNLIPGDPSALTTKSLRDSGFLQSSSRLTQSQPARYSNTLSSLSSPPAIIRPEVMKPSAFARPHRSALPQDPPVQSSLYLEELADMRGYRSLSQNRPSMTSIDSQQAFSRSTAYNRPPPDIPYNLRQSNTFKSRLPSVRDSLGYGNLGSSSYNPGSFMYNQSLGSTIPSSNFDDTFPSQNDGVRNFSPIQQQGSLSPWDYGAESRSLPRTDFRGQSNQSASQYINSGLSDPFHSQARLVAELKRLTGSQDLTSKQSHEFWRQNH
ncbi:hypothetical protein L6164_029329 [Bauhinia variegata]|uniref:Uncharacterized protein n=1 Tax=Bauhinia variegata TaxID=167791 RepID=A0ACB9L8C6_BAUVA|nr:hypothetical protein L6164_029329 [Bauhinia variegata]